LFWLALALCLRHLAGAKNKPEEQLPKLKLVFFWLSAFYKQMMFVKSFTIM